MNIDESLEEERIGKFDVKFKETCSTFYAGSVISGHVEIEVVDAIAVRGVRAQFRGESFVYWNTKNGDGDTTEVWKDHHTIWNQLFTIWGNKVNENESEDVTLAEGFHSFPFAVKVPCNGITSSFEHRHGAVRYWVKVYLDQKNCSNNNRYKPFTVLQKIDVGDKTFLTKVCNDAEKTVCCSCLGSKTLTLSASIDRNGYCPGESISVNCRGKNQARRDMGGIKARLIQTIAYTVGNQDKREENIISAIGGNKIEKGRTKVWENQLLKVPAVPPTIQDTGILSVTYKVQITLVVPNGVDLQFCLPITIGTKPRSYNNLNYKANVRFRRCVEGIECFNHSSKSYNFPLLAYVPYTCFMENYVFVPQRHLTSSEYTIHRHRTSSNNREKDEERQSLIDSTKNTFVT